MLKIHLREGERIRHIKPVAVLLGLIMVGGVGIAPVAASSSQWASSSVSQHQGIDQVNINHQSHNYGLLRQSDLELMMLIPTKR